MPWTYARTLLRSACLVCVPCATVLACGGSSSPKPEAADAGAEDSAAASLDADTPLRELALIDHSQWEAYDPSLDPLAEHQPEEISCSIAGWFVERGSLEVNTGECNYLLIQHPALVDVPEGSMIQAELYYYDLVAPEPATAHIAVLFGDDLQWETELDIPRPGNVQPIDFEATRALSAGEPIRLHLHNHGQNTWLLARVSVFVP